MPSFDSPPVGRSLRTAMPNGAAGFTLIEVLVVVVIVGIMATLAVLSVGGRSIEGRLADEARRLHEILLFAGDEAVLQGMELGFVQTAEGYEFLVLREGKWQPLEDGGPLRRRAVSRPFYLQLRVEGRPVTPARGGEQREEPKPQVLLLSSGEATEFTLDLRAEQHGPFWRLQGDALGHLKLERKEAA
jgi:general secretion pathway protein H